MSVVKWNATQRAFYESLFTYPDTFKELISLKEVDERNAKLKLLTMFFSPFRYTLGLTAEEKSEYRQACVSSIMSKLLEPLWSKKGKAANKGGEDGSRFLNDVRSLIAEALNANVSSENIEADEALCRELAVNGFMYFSHYQNLPQLIQMILLDFLWNLPLDLMGSLSLSKLSSANLAALSNPDFKEKNYPILYAAYKKAGTSSVEEILLVWETALKDIGIKKSVIDVFKVYYRNSFKGWDGIKEEVFELWQAQKKSSELAAFTVEYALEVNFEVHVSLSKRYFKALSLPPVDSIKLSAKEVAATAHEAPLNVMLISSGAVTDTVTIDPKSHVLRRKLTNKKRLEELKSAAASDATVTAIKPVEVRKVVHRSLEFASAANDGYHSDPDTVPGWPVSGNVKPMEGHRQLFFLLSEPVRASIVKAGGEGLLHRVIEKICSDDMRIEGLKRVVKVSGDFRIYANREGIKAEKDPGSTLLYFDEMGKHVGSGAVEVDVFKKP